MCPLYFRVGGGGRRVITCLLPKQVRQQAKKLPRWATKSVLWEEPVWKWLLRRQPSVSDTDSGALGAIQAPEAGLQSARGPTEIPILASRPWPAAPGWNWAGRCWWLNWDCTIWKCPLACRTPIQPGCISNSFLDSVSKKSLTHQTQSWYLLTLLPASSDINRHLEKWLLNKIEIYYFVT